MEEERVCLRCGGAAPWTKWESVTAKGIPSGREYQYQCTQCGHAFSLPGNGQMFLAAVTLALFVAFAASWWVEGWLKTAVASSLGCAALMVQTALRIRTRLRTRKLRSSPVRSELDRQPDP